MIALFMDTGHVILNMDPRIMSFLVMNSNHMNMNVTS